LHFAFFARYYSRWISAGSTVISVDPARSKCDLGGTRPCG
jgi:hypothetical protein